MKKYSPFDFIKSINEKNYLMVSPEVEKQYVPFMVNRGLSQMVDCVPYTYNMNRLTKLSKKMQYDYYYYGIRRAKRFSKWAKEDKYDHLDDIISYYNINKEKAIEYLERLTEEQVQNIVKKLNSFGGRI